MFLSSLVFNILESFNFTGKPADPIVVIDGVNSTEVQLVWNFTAAPSSSFAVIINRRRPTGSQLTQVASRNSLSGSSSAFNVPDPDTYEANLPATLVIKNVTRNDEYVYSISILDLGPGAVLVLFDEATVDVLCKYLNKFRCVRICTVACNCFPELRTIGVFHHFSLMPKLIKIYKLVSLFPD